MSGTTTFQSADNSAVSRPFSKIPPWLVLVGFWSLVALVIATLSHSRMVAVERPSQYVKWLIESLLIWNYWSLISPLIFALGNKLYVDRRRVRTAVLLLVAGLLIAVTFIAYQVGISMWVMGESFERYRATVIGQLAWFGTYALLIFGGIIAMGYARAYRNRWQARERMVHELETQLTRAQLDVLKSQLQPHFFFNTLNSISVLIRKGEPDLAQAMLGRLSELLRYSLSLGNRQTVPLGEEIDFVRGYLEIEKARFGDRLSVHIVVPDSCLSVPVPPLIIQPLVENAIRHGLADKAEGGKVSVIVAKTGEAIEIHVEDTGVGFDTNTSGRPEEGIGIGNTRARLERLYSRRYTLAIDSPPGGPTRVRIVIPSDLYPE